MEIALSGFYEIVSPRLTVLITTVDKDGRVNAAPFSFVTPVSLDPPLFLFAAAPARHTLANARETGEFVLNVPPEAALHKLWVCSKPFAKGVSEAEEAGLTLKKSAEVGPPSIEECIAWIECRVEFDLEAGDHVLVVGRVVHAECKDEFMKGEHFDVAKAKPALHIRGNRFAIPERVAQAKGD
jgi:flavin reductase (DIM6/NTAB) family NADH-FMN oxidoreductase RutF